MNGCQCRFDSDRIRNTKPSTMADIRLGLQGIEEPDRSIGLMLLEYYESMKSLERDEHRGGKQATRTIMAMSDIKAAVLMPEPSPVRQEAIKNLHEAWRRLREITDEPDPVKRQHLIDVARIFLKDK